MSGSYYEGLELLEHCNAIDFVDLVDHSFLIEEPKDNDLAPEGFTTDRKRSNSSSSVSSEFELPLLEEPIREFKPASNYGYVEKVIKRSKDEKFSTYEGSSNSTVSGGGNSSKSTGSHTSRYKKSKKNIELQHQAILSNPFLQHPFISSSNFSSNKEAVSNFTNILISKLLLNGIKSISLNNLKGFNSSSFATIAKSGSAANNLAEIALAVYNERFQVEDVQKHELCQRELLRIREQEVQRAKAAHEAEARNKTKLQQEAIMRKKEKDKMMLDSASYPANQRTVIDNVEQKKINSVSNATTSGRNINSEFTVEDFTIALKSLLKNKDLKLPDLSPQQVDIIARSPTFQNNKVIIDLIRTTIKAKKTLESTSEHSKEESPQPKNESNTNTSVSSQTRKVNETTPEIATSPCNISSNQSSNSGNSKTNNVSKAADILAPENGNIGQSSQNMSFRTGSLSNVAAKKTTIVNTDENNKEELIPKTLSDTTENNLSDKEPINFASLGIPDQQPLKDISSTPKYLSKTENSEVTESDQVLENVNGLSNNNLDFSKLSDKQIDYNVIGSPEEKANTENLADVSISASQPKVSFLHDKNNSVSNKETREAEECRELHNSEVIKREASDGNVLKVEEPGSSDS